MTAIEDLSDDPLLSYLSQHSVYEEGFIRLPKYNQVFNRGFENYMERIEKFPVSQDDIWITSFPKSGTTWTQEMVWCIMNGIGTDDRPQSERIPFFEMTAIADNVSREVLPDTFSMVEHCRSTPRFIKSHLMYDMLPEQARIKKPKIIHVTRNPRDVLVSLFYHWKLLDKYSGTFDKMCELFIEGKMGYYGSFFHNILSYWNRRHDRNILFLTYEEMKTDLPTVVNRTAGFLNKKLTEDDVSALCAHLSFKAMSTNQAVNKADYSIFAQQSNSSEDLSFMRKGIVGDWKNFIGGDMLESFKEWERKQMEGSDIKFVYE